MKHRIRLGWGFAAVWAAATPALAQTPAAAPGSSIQTAIQLPGVRNETQGVDAEYGYIKKNFPGWNLKAQSLVPEKGHQYDAITISGPGGKVQTIFFDITTWFGKR